MKELEEFRTRDIGRGGGSGYSANRTKYRSSGRVPYRQTSTSRTLGGTGGGPFWGWGYYPYTTVMYPIFDYADYPESIDVIPVVESKKIIEKYINVKTIMPTYK